MQGHRRNTRNMDVSECVLISVLFRRNDANSLCKSPNCPISELVNHTAYGSTIQGGKNTPNTTQHNNYNNKTVEHFCSKAEKKKKKKNSCA